MTAAKILIVEDEGIIAKSLKVVLEEFGYEISSITSSGEEAIKKVKKDKPDLVLMDIVLKGDINGIEAAKKIKSDFNIPVIYLTAYTDKQILERAKITEPFGYIVKPFENRELCSTIEIALYKNQMEKRIDRLNRMLRAVRNVNQLINREQDRNILLQKACTHLIETQGYFSAWVALLDKTNKLITTAEAGLGKDFLPMVSLLKHGKPPYCITKALVKTELVVIKDASSICRECPISEKYCSKGALTIRLQSNNKIYGVLSVSIDLSLLPLDEELSLFTEVTEDIAFALRNIELEEGQKQAEGELRKSEERFRLAVNATKDGLWEWDIQTNQEFFSHRWCEIIGYSFDDPELPHTYNSWASRIHPDDYDRVVSALNSHLEKGTIYDVNYRHRHKSGEYRWQNSTGQTVLDESGKPVKMVGCISDITERMQAEEELKLHAIRLRTLLDLHTMTGASDKKFFDFILEASLRITRSKYAFVGLMNEDESVMTIHAWSKDAMKECTVHNAPIDYTIKDTGIWGDAVRLRKPIIINDYTNHPGKKGYPEGHVQIQRFLCVPVFDGKRIVMVAAVANKEENYDYSDALATISLINDAWHIIKQQQSTESLRQAEQKYRSIFENSMEGIYQSTPEGQFLSLNPAMAHIYGYESPKEMIMSITNIGKQLYVDPEDRKRYKNILEEYGTVNNFKTQSPKKDGDIIWVSLSARAVKDATGKVLYYEGIVEDITDRKRAEEKLRESEEKYRNIFNDAILGIYQTTPEGRFLSANPALARMYGYDTPEELINSMTDLATQLYVNPEDREIFKRSFSREGVVERFETRLRKKGGEIIWVSINTHIVKDTQGNISSYEGTVEDITERKRAEEALAFNSIILRTQQESSIDGILVVDEKGGILSFNQRFVDMWGIPLDVIESKSDERALQSVMDKLASPEEFIRKVKHLYEVRDEISRDEVVLKDGRTFDRYSAPMLGAGGKYYGRVWYFRDITERKLAEEELKQTLEKLRKALGGTIRAMAATVETRDPYTAGHQKRVTRLARSIAQEMGLSKDTIEGIRMAGIIHDIGKISVPAEILSKPTKLTDMEFNLIKIHPQSGYDILKEIDFPWPIAQIVLQHHERMDGSGYPNLLKNGQIIVEAKILAVADVVESMASHRPYRPALGIDVALNEIEQNKGALYDTEAVEVCVRLFREKGFTFE